MAEPRFYNALIAESLCSAGKFVVCGLTLKPFSLIHSAQLDALESPLWSAASDPEDGDIAIAAQICASSSPVVNFTTLPHETKADWETWINYLEVCAARPMLKEAVRCAVGSTMNAPTEMLIASYLLRVTNLDERRIWTMPYGLAMWYLESIREQETGESMILTQEESDELDRLNTEEEKAKRKAREAIAIEIIESTQDCAKRYELLRMCQSDSLPENWREGLTHE